MYKSQKLTELVSGMYLLKQENLKLNKKISNSTRKSLTQQENKNSEQNVAMPAEQSTCPSDELQVNTGRITTNQSAH